MGNHTSHAMKQFNLTGFVLIAYISPDCFAQILRAVKTTVLLPGSGDTSSKSSKFSITGSLSYFCRHAAILVKDPGILSWSIQQTSSQELSVCSPLLALKHTVAWTTCYSSLHRHEYPSIETTETVPQRSPSMAVTAKAQTAN